MFKPLFIIIDFRLLLLPYFGCCYCQLPWYWQMLLSPLRLMLLPYFRWLIADVMPYILASVIANFVEDVKPHIVWTICNKCRLMLLPVADGMATAGGHIDFMDINIFPYTLWCYKICRNNISFSLEKAHSSEQKLGSSKNIISAIEKIN